MDLHSLSRLPGQILDEIVHFSLFMHKTRSREIFRLPATVAAPLELTTSISLYRPSGMHFGGIFLAISGFEMSRCDRIPGPIPSLRLSLSASSGGSLCDTDHVCSETSWARHSV
jgi:hypothetical protein